ncbi:hypothetical protein GCM10010433_61580 [Streptomyces pulveraceus]|uniref:Uncharacterized protein n=1 Tax=Streptomyces pulveraceus TaxID=68258 RepID=A0ABW1GZF1_9ACTN
MTADRARVLIERLRATDRSDDSTAYEHANARAPLMRECLRRAARWAQAYGPDEQPEVDHIHITEIEAAAFIESTTKKLTGSR